ncbi:hypothetical protein [Puia dinghuensis]|uniref:ABC transporter ATPase n=1 Tax=Puia dinghuensis TaxID=1792502 RepID=A0A8J2XQL3_9BACT|nr:hypothetical protein [Puia dinghuensis]GGA85537.1 hypothetical protein GCM10011511_05680 [Puia dinghuensis]
MKAHHSELIPDDFAPDSRVWIYQSPRLFFLSEALEIEKMLEAFVADWKSHGTPVKGYANLFYGQFLVLMADETATGVSGCSTDSSVRLIKDIEQRFGVPLFDRLMLAFRVKDKVEMVPLAQLPYALENGFITPDTLYFNNTVQTKVELETKWLIPLKNSWLASRHLKPAETGN